MEFNAEMVDMYIIPWSIKIITALAIFIIGKWIARSITDVAKKILRKANQDEMLVKFLGSILYSILFVAVVLAALISSVLMSRHC